MHHISSRQNPVVSRYRGVARGERAGDRELLLLDGAHLIEEALTAGLAIRHALVGTDALNRPSLADLAHRLETSGVELVSVSGPVLAAASPVTSPSGIVALADRPPSTESLLYARTPPLIVVACDIQDPGNLGAIARVAEAAGATGMVCAGVSADPFSWKALRGSMGSALRLPLLMTPDINEAVATAAAHHCRTVATVPRGGASLFETAFEGPLALLIGGEGGGLAPAIVDAADVRVTIPMRAPVDSLNASVAAAVLLYEVKRQRPAVARGTMASVGGA